ncbi:MAG: DUF3365 domain-containing protein [Rickettsiales bacterium]
MNNRLYLCGATLLINCNFSSPAIAGDEENAKNMATLFMSGRAVISEYQSKINDPDIGEKGLTGDFVVSAAKEKYKERLNKRVDEKDPNQRAIVEAIREVMAEAQPVINQKDKTFKGFLPAVFASQVASKASQKMNGKAFIKLTAPKELVRNKRNSPDSWENTAIETIFKIAGYEKGKPYSELTEEKGQIAFRYIQPEYYKKSCLNCHGKPKGERDISGGIKEGASLDDLGGAVSITFFK